MNKFSAEKFDLRRLCVNKFLTNAIWRRIRINSSILFPTILSCRRAVVPSRRRAWQKLGGCWSFLIQKNLKKTICDLYQFYLPEVMMSIIWIFKFFVSLRLFLLCHKEFTIIIVASINRFNISGFISEPPKWLPNIFLIETYSCDINICWVGSGYLIASIH